MTDELISSKLLNDSRLKEAKKLILSAVEEHSQKITEVKPPSNSLKINYEKIIKEFSKMRGGSLWYPYIGSGIGNGALVELLDGSVKYDFISGIGAHYFGHSHKEMVSASIDASVSNTPMQGHLQQNYDSVKLTELLIHASGLDCCFLTTSGAMANENGLKIAFQKSASADRVLAFDHAFAGRTLAIAQITDKPQYREGLPNCLSVDYVPFYDPLDPKGSTERALSVLKTHLNRYPNKHACMIFELVQGEGGFNSGDKNFFITLMEELKRHSVYVFIDEVQTFGRTPALFAFQYYQLENYVDLVSIGKLSQISATLYRSELKPKPGLLSQTFTASTSMIRCGTYVIEHLMQGNLFGKTGEIQELHNFFVKGLKKIESRHPKLIEGPYGIGAMIAFTPFQGDHKKVLEFSHALFDAGVISFITGTKPTRIRFLIPAGTITKKDIETVLKIVEKTLSK